MRLPVWILLSLLLFAQAEAGKKNVVFILVDDWGWADAGVQGSDFFETPNIDRLAREGMRFTQAYAAAAICSPTRAAILTGKSPARLDMTIWHEGAVRGGPKSKRLLEAKAQPNLPRGEVTLAELFKKEDYFTAHIGKWHLGKAAFYPETQGYDVNIGGTCWGAPATFYWPYRGPWSKNDPELRYVPVGSGKSDDYLTDQLTDHALRIITQQKDRPFFLSLWFHTVHTPIEGKPDLVKRFEKKPPGKIHSHAEYAAMLASLDENVGRVLRRIDDLKLTDHTVVILTSDNGGVDFSTAKSDNRPPTSNAPFRSGKGTLYEGGLRVPLIIRWPGRTKAGSECAAQVTSQDFFPTLADALGQTDVPRHDGVSLLPLLENPKASLNREALFWHYPHYYPRMTPASAIRAGDWKLIQYYEDNRLELFNLKTDPAETKNLAATQPAKTKALRKKLDAWRKETDAKAPTKNPDWRQLRK
ncbi:MAG: sulfatase [Verrucomicrobiales bacterium]|nr:sulfatase [Verrucomicrobiales bacterium]